MTTTLSGASDHRDLLVAQARELSERSHSTPPSIALDAFVQLVSLLLRCTVLHADHVVARTVGPARMLIGAKTSADKLEAVRLKDDTYLRTGMVVEIVDRGSGPAPHVVFASYQHQLDADRHEWLWRYDYADRQSQNVYPPAHLQVNGRFAMGQGRELPKVHFPTGRISLEAVIRLLADQLGVPCNEHGSVWRAVLGESERLFYRIAHQPLSGPET